ncbi:hypothetical protein [Sphingomonas oryzagri]
MSRLDPRLAPLITTLADAGADWLAFELMDGIRRGREREEIEDVLAFTRDQVRQGEIVKRGKEFSAETVPAESIPMDEQIEWAALFVANRLDAALADMSAAIDNLQILAGPLDSAKAIGASEPIIVLLDGEEQRQAGRADVESARLAVSKLRTALGQWVLEARGTSET